MEGDAPNVDKPLDGQAAVVTGAASGMGRAIALKLAAAGASVLAVDRDAEGLAGLDGVCSHVADLFESAAAEAMIDACVSRFSRIDILVNNAGVMDRYQGVAALDLDVWERTLRINLEAPMRALRRATPLMLAQGSGAIVNVVSVSGVSGAAGGAAYTATKHGLLGLSRSTAWMYAKRGLRCNAILPGAVRTNIGQTIIGDIPAEDLARAREHHALIPRVLEADDIADLALFLVGPASRHINGAEVSADGGWLAA